MKKARTGLIVETMEAASAAGVTHAARAATVRHGACTVTTVKIESDDDAKLLRGKREHMLRLKRTGYIGLPTMILNQLLRCLPI